ncbi:MAG: hypothetical protein ABJZ55_07965 [Fuerstiella sp.]
MNLLSDNSMQTILQAVSSRMWLNGCLRRFSKAVLIGAVVAVALAAGRSLFAFQHLALMTGVLVCGLLWLAWQSVLDFRRLQDLAIAARWTDHQAALNNRLTTAVELPQANPNAIQALLLEDASEQLQTVNPKTIVDLPSAKSSLFATAALLGALSLLVFSPVVARSGAADPTIQTSHPEANLSRLLGILESVLAELKGQAETNPSDELDALIHETEAALQAIEEGEVSTAEAYLELSKLQQQMLANHQGGDLQQDEATWQKVADALSTSESTNSIAELLQSKQFQQAASKMEDLDPRALAKQKLTPAEITSLTEQLTEAAEQSEDDVLADVLKDLSTAIKDGSADTASQMMQDLAAESAKYQIALDQAEHLDDLSEQLEIGKQQLAISSNSSGDGQMGGQGLNEETGESKGKGGADSQKAGAKTAGNIDGPKADLAGQKQLAELQGQFGEHGDVEVKTKSTTERPDIEIHRQASSVITEYSQQLEADLKQQQVPAGHQGIVRKYFESIRPPIDDRK